LPDFGLLVTTPWSMYCEGALLGRCLAKHDQEQLQPKA